MKELVSLHHTVQKLLSSLPAPAYVSNFVPVLAFAH